jgi:hypothetical protein
MTQRPAIECEILDPTVEFERLPCGDELADTIIMPLQSEDLAQLRPGVDDEVDGSDI